MIRSSGRYCLTAASFSINTSAEGVDLLAILHLDRHGRWRGCDTNCPSGICHVK